MRKTACVTQVQPAQVRGQVYDMALSGKIELGSLNSLTFYQEFRDVSALHLDAAE